MLWCNNVLKVLISVGKLLLGMERYFCERCAAGRRRNSPGKDRKGHAKEEEQEDHEGPGLTPTQLRTPPSMIWIGLLPLSL